jgi:hypothetical protein
MEQCWGILVQIQSKADCGIILSELVLQVWLPIEVLVLDVVTLSHQLPRTPCQIL